MAFEATTPSRTLRRFGRDGEGLVCSDIGALSLLGLGGLDLPLPEDRVDAGDLSLHLTQAGVVVELAGGVLEAQVEQLLFGLSQVREELAVVHLAQLCRSGHQRASPARVT